VKHAYQDAFVVFALDEFKSGGHPQAIERAVATCPSHEDAARVRQEYRDSGRRCVIRCISETGGGD
jgi:hypothetical protein